MHMGPWGFPDAPANMLRRINLGDAGFVVGAQQGGSVGDDQLLTCIRRQSLRIEEDAACLIQREVAAAIEDTAGGGHLRREHPERCPCGQ